MSKLPIVPRVDPDLSTLLAPRASPTLCIAMVCPPQRIRASGPMSHGRALCLLQAVTRPIALDERMAVLAAAISVDYDYFR